MIPATIVATITISLAAALPHSCGSTYMHITCGCGGCRLKASVSCHVLWLDINCVSLDWHCSWQEPQLEFESVMTVETVRLRTSIKTAAILQGHSITTVGGWVKVLAHKSISRNFSRRKISEPVARVAPLLTARHPSCDGVTPQQLWQSGASAMTVGKFSCDQDNLHVKSWSQSLRFFTDLVSHLPLQGHYWSAQGQGHPASLMVKCKQNRKLVSPKERENRQSSKLLNSVPGKHKVAMHSGWSDYPMVDSHSNRVDFNHN